MSKQLEDPLEEFMCLELDEFAQHQRAVESHLLSIRELVLDLVQQALQPSTFKNGRALHTVSHSANVMDSDGSGQKVASTVLQEEHLGADDASESGNSDGAGMCFEAVAFQFAESSSDPGEKRTPQRASETWSAGGSETHMHTAVVPEGDDLLTEASGVARRQSRSKDHSDIVGHSESEARDTRSSRWHFPRFVPRFSKKPFRDSSVDVVRGEDADGDKMIMLGNFIVDAEDVGSVPCPKVQETIGLDGGRVSERTPSGVPMSKQFSRCSTSKLAKQSSATRLSGKERLLKQLTGRLGGDCRPTVFQHQRSIQYDATQRVQTAYAHTQKFFQETSIEESRIIGASTKLFERSSTVHKHIVNARCLTFRCVEHFVESWAFTFGVIAIIVTNAVFVGVTADLSMRNAVSSYHNQSGLKYADILRSNRVITVDLLFNSIFALELFLRILAQQGSFFFGPEWNWNFIDTVVVALAFVDTALLSIGFSPSYIRVLRVAKVVRPVRMIRILRLAPMFNKLHALMLAFTRCGSMLISAVVFLWLMMFVFSIVFSSAVAAYISDADYGNTHVAQMQTFFGSLLMTMLTLFMTISGGVDWWDVCSLLLEIGTVYVLFFLLFVVISVLAVLNVINAIFVNDAVDATQRDLDLRSQAELAKNRAMLTRLTHIFHAMEKDRRDMVSIEAFMKHMDDEDMKNHLSLIGLSWIDGVSLFRFLDTDQRNSLTIDEFVMGCLRLNGEAILVDLDVEVKQTRDMIMDLHEKFVSNQPPQEAVFLSASSSRSSLRSSVRSSRKPHERSEAEGT